MYLSDNLSMIRALFFSRFTQRLSETNNSVTLDGFSTLVFTLKGSVKVASEFVRSIHE